MSVLEHDPDGVIAHGLKIPDGGIPLARDGLALSLRMTPNLRAGAAHAQIFRRQIKTFPRIEGDMERPAIRPQPQLRGPHLGG